MLHIAQNNNFQEEMENILRLSRFVHHLRYTKIYIQSQFQLPLNMGTFWI